MAAIAAIKIISLSELYTADSNWTEMKAMQDQGELEQVLWDAGLDTNEYHEHQFNSHRNALNQVYTGSRWVGMERTDPVWLGLGFASTEAKDRAKGSKLLNDLYRSKGLTMDRQSGVFEPEEFEKPGYVETEDDTEVDQAVDDSIWDLQVKQLADFEMQRDVIATDETKQQKEKE